MTMLDHTMRGAAVFTFAICLGALSLAAPPSGGVHLTIPDHAWVGTSSMPIRGRGSVQEPRPFWLPR